MTLFVVSMIVLLVFVIGASLGRSRVEPLVADAFEATEGVRADFPSVAVLLDSGRVQEMVLDAVTTIANVYRDGAIPFALGGAVLFLVAAAYPKYAGSFRRNKAADSGAAPPESTGVGGQAPDNV
jgi:hypothetical protein